MRVAHLSAFGVAGIACLAMTPPAHGQRIQELGDAESVFPEPFTRIAGLRELADGRVVVADQTERHISFLDFAAGTMREIGRRGAGPGEYETPGALLPLPHNVTLLVDMGNMRLTRILPDGELDKESWPMMTSTGSFIRPTGTDAKGHFYYSGGGIMINRGGGSGATPSDSQPILRWDPVADVADTVGAFYSPSTRGGGSISLSRGGSGGIAVSGMRYRPFNPQDAWVIAPDGGVAVVRARSYGIDWYRGGVATAGPEVDFDPVRINNAEKEAWADRQASSTATFVAMGGSGGGRGGGGTFEVPRPDLDEVEFPDFKPPFPSNAARVTPEGEVWVMRHQSHRDERRALFDVFDQRGELVKQVQLPEGRRLVGFGDSVLYAVVTDEDDLQWLERYSR
jgi:hypothetical protein